MPNQDEYLQHEMDRYANMSEDELCIETGRCAPGIEVVWHHRDSVAESGIKFGERHQVLEPGEWVLWARRVMGWPDLLVYRHRVRGSFVLVDLVYPDAMIGREIKVLPAAPDQGGWMGRVWLERHANPAQVTCDELEDKWMKDKETRQDARVRSEAVRKDVQRHLYNKGDEEISRALDYQPYSDTDDTKYKANFINNVVRRT